MSVTAYPTLRLKLTVPQALKLRFLPAIPGTNAANAAAAAEAAAVAALAAAAEATAATAGKVDKAGDTMTGFLTLSANPTAFLHAATKQYVDSAIGGSGDVTTSGGVTATQLAGFADATGNVIRGVTVGAGLDMAGGTSLTLDSDLSAIAALTGVNTIYYRSSDAVWTEVTIGTGLSFAGGTLSAPGAGNVSNTGTPTNGQFARWTTATTIEGISAATALTAIGAQPLDADLTALAALSGTSTIYYRSAADTWSPVLIGANMSFAGGTLSSSGSGGTGVAAVGVPTAGQIARWTTATTIEGVSLATAGIQPLDATLTALAGVTAVADRLPYFDGTDTATVTTFSAFARTYLDDADAVTTRATIGAQAADADLTSLAAAAATNAIYYRSAADTWGPVTIGSNLSFSAGTLNLAASPTVDTASPGDNDTTAASTAFVTAAITTAVSALSTLPVGTSIIFNGSSPPTNYLIEDGSTLNSVTFSALFAVLVKSATVTMTIASPCVVTWTSNTLTNNVPIKFTTTGALPTGLVVGTVYYVKGLSGNTFNVSATAGGAAINTSGSQSGTHTGINAPHVCANNLSTFNIPDSRGEFIRGWDIARGIDSNRGFGQSQLDQFQGHQHSYETPNVYDELAGSLGTPVVARVLTNKNTLASGTSDGVSGSARIGLETRPRNVTKLICIKYQ